jgi:hypothetical protein
MQIEIRLLLEDILIMGITRGNQERVPFGFLLGWVIFGPSKDQN